MTNTFILMLDLAASESLAGLRLFPNIDVAQLNEEIYVRVKTNERFVPFDLKRLPATSTYILDEGLLFPLNKEVPVGKLPKLAWLSLNEFINVEPPTSSMPGSSMSFRMINLVATEVAKETEVLLTSFQHWQNYVEGAPNFRLKKLQYALAKGGQVLIWGTPLPPIPGMEYWKSHQLLIPAGMDLEFPVLSSTVSKKITPVNDELILFYRQGTFEKISLTHFVSASRSSVRMSKANIS